MPDVSAAIVVLAGTVLVVTGTVSSSMTDTSRQRMVGMGYLVASFGLLAWLLAFGMLLTRAMRAS